MLRVFICEDNSKHLAKLTKIAQDFIEDNNLDVILAFSTPNPNEMIDHISANKATGLYFLDLDLSCETDGFQLAKEIRQHDPRAFIVIATGDTQSRMLTFKHVIEAMDYITKDSPDFRERIGNCIRSAYDRHMVGTADMPNRIEFKLTEDTI